MAFDDIISIDALLGKQKDPLYEDTHGGKHLSNIACPSAQFGTNRLEPTIYHL